MKINYNESENTIEIKDGLKNQYVVIYLCLIFAFVNSVIQTLMLDKKQMEWTAFIWIILGILSMILLTYQILKKTASEKLNVSEISSLVEKDVFGRKRISLKLKNGKLRDLMEMKKQSDITQTKELFKNIVIKIN